MKNAAGLRVFAPSRENTSKPARLPGAKKPVVKKPVSKQDESLSKPESQPSIEIQKTRTKKKANKGSAQTFSFGQRQRNTQLPTQAVVAEPDSSPKVTFAALFAFLPSWLVSMVFHLTLLIALAILTLSSPEKKTVVLEIAEATEPLTEVFEVMVLEQELEDTVEAFEELSEGPITPMDPVLSAEMIDQFELGDDNFANNDIPGGEALAQALPPAGDTEGEQTPKKTAQFFGIESEGNRFVFVIDASGSMAQEYRWTLAVEELRKSIEELEYTQEFVIYLYNHQTWPMLGVKPGTAEYLEANEENKARIYSWLNRALPFGDTRPSFSMRLALNHKPDAIFLLSDGELKDDTVGQLQTWNTSLKYGGIPINTVFLGNGMGGMTMKTIADQNEGVFKWVR